MQNASIHGFHRVRAVEESVADDILVLRHGVHGHVVPLLVSLSIVQRIHQLLVRPIAVTIKVHRILHLLERDHIGIHLQDGVHNPVLLHVKKLPAIGAACGAVTGGGGVTETIGEVAGALRIHFPGMRKIIQHIETGQPQVRSGFRKCDRLTRILNVYRFGVTVTGHKFPGLKAPAIVAVL